MFAIIGFKSDNIGIYVAKSISCNFSSRADNTIPDAHLKAIIAAVAERNRKKSISPSEEEIAVIKAVIRDYCKSKEIRLVVRPPAAHSAWKLAARLRM